MTCPRCAAPQDGSPNFCTACGYDLRPSPERPAARPLPPPVVRLVACPACGASNAGSRRHCGRCRSALHEAPATATRAEPEAAGGREPKQRDSSPILLVVTLVAALAIVGVLLSLLGAQGVGFLAGPPEEPTEAAAGSPVLLAARATASSTLQGSGTTSYDPANLVDGDPETAWNEGSRGDGVGEWVELTLAAPADVTRVLLWNGYQKGEQFPQNGRVRQLRIDAGERTFEVELLDVEGPQAVNLPQPVRAQRVRLTIDDVYVGDRYPDVALSEIEVYGVP